MAGLVTAERGEPVALNPSEAVLLTKAPVDTSVARSPGFSLSAWPSTEGNQWPGRPR
ncbi:hypothetical protein QF032_003242 [Streptomyces achromogenes]|uniref:hypothetical protein n=1 Tax=Streptomyces achromogenes TaxID=67255 RepID=UPI0027842CC2|nr:hypothetical protein [Streptomyces achromogenes]MDQ0831398.1 hypothetical protein [Streptomyces achromogenes]